MLCWRQIIGGTRSCTIRSLLDPCTAHSQKQEMLTFLHVQVTLRLGMLDSECRISSCCRASAGGNGSVQIAARGVSPLPPPPH